MSSNRDLSSTSTRYGCGRTKHSGSNPARWLVEQSREKDTTAKMNAIGEVSGPAYIMGRNNEEYGRLRRQAELLRPATESVLARVGLNAGMRCLDVGCGPCEVMRIMAHRVGSSGQVIGLDVDCRLGEESVASLRSEGLGQCAFVEGDLRYVEHIRGEPFDLVFARLVLLHLDDPVAALRKLYKWVKPGGSILVQEFHFAPLDSYPRFEPTGELMQTFFGVCTKVNKDPAIALKLPHHFVSAGIGTPDHIDVAGHYLPTRVGARMVSDVYKSILPLALQFGLTTPERRAQFFESVEDIQEDAYMMMPLLFSAWKQKPQSAL